MSPQLDYTDWGPIQRYAAIGLTGDRSYDDFQTLRAMPIHEEMVVAGAWWDYVDGIASDRLGHLLRKYPKAMKRRMFAWNRSSDL
jgi:hypothetical protein